MKKSWAKKWVKALRSGKYKQTKKTLKDENGYCCLGVLCSIVKPKKRWTYFSTLPDFVTKKVGMINIGGVGYYGEDKNLANRNDFGDSFEQIADIIEKEWEKL
jgi:hypothetical protein